MKSEQMKDLERDLIDLKDSPLYEYRLQNNYFPVIGEGSYDSSIMLVGEAPGKNEAETGKPFCGRSGKILDELLDSIGVARKDVYVTSIVKDRPPKNRDPELEEIRIYGPFLDRQISIIKPKVIATLGRFSMTYVMEKFGLEEELKPIGVLHGRVFAAKAAYGEISIVPLYHPAASIYKQSLLATLKDDFEVLRNAI